MKHHLLKAITPGFFPSLLLVMLLWIMAGCSDPETALERRAARIHQQVFTVDTHTDTPLRITQGDFDFGVRNAPVETNSKVDLPRMKEGEMDAIWFAVFLGQGDRTEEGHRRAQEQAMEITGAIHQLADEYPEQLVIATGAGDLKRIARQGKHAIYLGMENGYPIGNDLSLIDTFYQKGIRYITLVHSSNNDICDSSTDTIEHGGLSSFGEQVVDRMNDLGMMIDLSHASDETVLDVLGRTRTPVIASHSCARALCDHPRNLSDDLLLKLKENGGVIQLCLYSGYLKILDPSPERDSAQQAVYEKHGNYYKLDEEAQRAFLEDWFAVDRDFPPGLATVSEAVDHLDHMVELIGIDHVGIGSDFDGGGELADCFDVSQMGNITLELVRRGYSPGEIRKIWGGNITRVFRKVEQAAI